MLNFQSINVMVVGVKFLRPGMANQTVSGAEKDSMTSNCNYWLPAWFIHTEPYNYKCLGCT